MLRLSAFAQLGERLAQRRRVAAAGDLLHSSQARRAAASLPARLALDRRARSSSASHRCRCVRLMRARMHRHVPSVLRQEDADDALARRREADAAADPLRSSLRVWAPSADSGRGRLGEDPSTRAAVRAARPDDGRYVRCCRSDRTRAGGASSSRVSPSARRTRCSTSRRARAWSRASRRRASTAIGRRGDRSPGAVRRRGTNSRRPYDSRRDAQRSCRSRTTSSRG